MKATEIFSQRIVTSNTSLDETMPQSAVEKYVEKNDDHAYNYEYLFNTGKLEALLKNPKNSQPDEIIFRQNDEEGSRYNGLELHKGQDFILPLVFLHNELSERLVKDAMLTEVLVRPGIRGDVGIRFEEWDTYIKELESIYNLHYALTRGFYKRAVAKLSDEECKFLLNEIDNLEINIVFL